jgi:hypothetical protein
MADTAAFPEHDAVRALAAALGNRANELAERGRTAEVPALWEEAIAGLEDAAARDRLTLAYAWYQGLHEEVEHGVRLAAGLRESDVTQVRGQLRVLVRQRWRVEPALVERTWQEATGARLPRWAFLSDDDVDAVAAWISAESWDESKARYDAVIAGLPWGDVEAVLEELLLDGSRLRVTVAAHRAVLALGADTGYRCLRGPREAAGEASKAVAARDWDALGACAAIETAHGSRLLSWVHAVIARLMPSGEPTLTSQMTEKFAELITVLARTSESWERERAAEDLAVFGVPSIVAPLR